MVLKAVKTTIEALLYIVPRGVENIVLVGNPGKTRGSRNTAIVWTLVTTFEKVVSVSVL